MKFRKIFSFRNKPPDCVNIYGFRSKTQFLLITISHFSIHKTYVISRKSFFLLKILYEKHLNALCIKYFILPADFQEKSTEKRE